MTLALLTGITDSLYTFIGHNWKFMTMQNMANYGSSRMTKACMPVCRGHTHTTEHLRSMWHRGRIKRI
jgi:hypothetical protein